MTEPAMNVLFRFAAAMEDLARTNPSRWGDMDRVAAVLREELEYELSDDD